MVGNERVEGGGTLGVGSSATRERVDFVINFPNEVFVRSIYGIELLIPLPQGETCSFEVVWDDRKGKSSAANVMGNGDGMPSKGGKGGGKGGFGGGYGGGW